MGAFSLLIAADDFFKLHDAVLPRLFGMPELLTYAIYAGTALLIAASFWRSLVRSTHVG
ncbi:hypothetical protein LCGC14_1381860 [marine sediment metagenome]|uniref:Uncharacterized protein n=1 Tax=marine sediment metagenome TaxID=412755 RepID=A0A0F9K2V1_9ZZZZ